MQLPSRNKLGCFPFTDSRFSFSSFNRFSYDCLTLKPLSSNEGVTGMSSGRHLKAFIADLVTMMEWIVSSFKDDLSPVTLLANCFRILRCPHCREACTDRRRQVCPERDTFRQPSIESKRKSTDPTHCLALSSTPRRWQSDALCQSGMCGPQCWPR